MKAKWDGKKKAVVLTTVMTAVVLTLRIVLMPMMQEAHTGRFRLSYIVIAIMLLTLLAAALLCSPVLASGSHAVTAEFDSALGSVALETDKGVAGDNIYFTVTPSAMYTPENPKITTASGSAVQCYASGSENGVYKYYFSMPDDAVTVSVSFAGPFDDVAASDWFSAEVLRAYSAGLMTGTDEGRIDPQGNATRAEAATILQRFLES